MILTRQKTTAALLTARIPINSLTGRKRIPGAIMPGYFPATGAPVTTYTVKHRLSGLNNISLGYTVPKELSRKARIESLKIYASVNNAAVYSPDWNYWDPEFRNRDGNGVISTAIPPRYYTLGLNLTF